MGDNASGWQQYFYICASVQEGDTCPWYHMLAQLCKQITGLQNNNKKKTVYKLMKLNAKILLYFVFLFNIYIKPRIKCSF